MGPPSIVITQRPPKSLAARADASFRMHALYPHSKGRTSLAYSPCGKYLFTVGENMMVRRFLVGSPQDEPETVELAFTGHDIATTASGFVVCGSSGEAVLFDNDSQAQLRSLVRTALPLRRATVSGDGNWVGLVGDDFCRVVHASDITQTLQVGVEGGDVRALEFHPSKPAVVAVSGLDSTVRVIDLESRAELGIVEAVLPAVTDFTDNRSTSAVWSPQGAGLAMPTKTFDIALVGTHDWLIGARLSGHTNAVTTLNWSPNGRYIASGARDDRVIVWDVASRRAVNEYAVIGVLEVRWHPHSNELSFVTSKGQLYTVGDVVRDDLHAPFGGDAQPALPTEATPRAKQLNFDLEAESNANGGRNDHGNRGGLSDEESDLFVSDDVGAGEYMEPGHLDPGHLEPGHIEPGHIEPGVRRHSAGHASDRHGRSHKRQRVDLTALSAAPTSFQNGSTPWLNQKRYLCMSPVGYIWSVRHPAQHNSITTTFFDQSLHREVHFQDRDAFDLAALTAQAAVYAQSTTAKVAVRFHSSLSENWETQLDLEIDGGVQCVALSSEVAAVFTKNGFMRTYTLYGSPLSVQRTPCAVLTASAFANEVLAIHYVQGAYSYTYEDVAQGRIFQAQAPLALPANVKLTSVFFSDAGEPCIMDSMGVLSTLLHGRVQGQARWVPIFSPPKQDSEVQRRYWPLGVLDSTVLDTKLLCVVLKGQQQYPAIPLPITDEVDLATPGVPEPEARFLVTRTQFEQRQDRLEYASQHLGVEISEADQETLEDHAIELDKMLLRQFQGACQDQRLNRGLQIVQLIRSPESLQAAAKVAAAYELKTLATRILEAIE